MVSAKSYLRILFDAQKKQPCLKNIVLLFCLGFSFIAGGIAFHGDHLQKQDVPFGPRIAFDTSGHYSFDLLDIAVFPCERTYKINARINGKKLPVDCNAVIDCIEMAQAFSYGVSYDQTPKDFYHFHQAGFSARAPPYSLS